MCSAMNGNVFLGRPIFAHGRLISFMSLPLQLPSFDIGGPAVCGVSQTPIIPSMFVHINEHSFCYGIYPHPSLCPNCANQHTKNSF